MPVEPWLAVAADTSVSGLGQCLNDILGGEAQCLETSEHGLPERVIRAQELPTDGPGSVRKVGPSSRRVFQVVEIWQRISEDSGSQHLLAMGKTATERARSAQQDRRLSDEVTEPPRLNG